MKAAIRAIAIVLVSLVLTSKVSFALVYNWSQAYTGTSWQSFGAVATDASGNIYVAGSFYNTVNFGGGDRTSNGGYDICLVKFDATGAYVWDETFGDADLQSPTAVVVDGAGDVYMAGILQGSVNFGGGVLTSAGDRDIFLAKFNPGGVHLWSKRFGDAAAQEARGLAVDAANEVYMVGPIKGATDFGGGPLTSQGDYDAFIAKFDANGTHLWSKRFGDSVFQGCHNVATDAVGNVFFDLEFRGSVDVGGGNVSSTNSLDFLLVKFDTAGNYQWADHFGGPGDQIPGCLATNPSEGSVYLAGTNNGTIDLGGGPIVSAGGGDPFLAKFDGSGAHLWSHGFGDASSSQAINCLAVDALGDVYIAGINEGIIRLGTASLASVGGRDIFLGVFSSAGDHIWSHSFGSANDQSASGLAVDSDYNVIMCGSFFGKVDFGGSIFTADEMDAFLVQFGPSATGVRAPLRNAEALWVAPNPFNPVTTVHFNVAQPSRVRVDVFDARGARVARLVDRDYRAGTFTATWNGVDDRGNRVGSGVYFARLSAGATESHVKLVLLK